MSDKIFGGAWICPNPACPAVIEEWSDVCHECKTPRPANAEIYDLVRRPIPRAVDLPQVCAQCGANHGDMSCAEFQALPMWQATNANRSEDT